MIGSASAAAVGHRPGTAGWWRERYATDTRVRRPRPDGLTLEGVLDAAIVVVDRHGLEALTMRRLAQELDTAHTSLYRHVASRDELLVLAVDHLLGHLSAFAVPPASTPRQAAEAGLRAYRQLLLAHPGMAPLFAAGQLLGPNALAGRDTGLRLLIEAGAPRDLAAEAYLTLTHFVIGSAQLDVNGAARTATERLAMTDLFESLPPDRYPTLVPLAPELARTDPDGEFEFGLAALLDGIEGRIRAR